MSKICGGADTCCWEETEDPAEATEDQGKGGQTQTGYEPQETQTLKAEEAKGKKRAEKAHDDGATTKSS